MNHQQGDRAGKLNGIDLGITTENVTTAIASATPGVDIPAWVGNRISIGSVRFWKRGRKFDDACNKGPADGWTERQKIASGWFFIHDSTDRPRFWWRVAFSPAIKAKPIE